jgi:hypothetical protein
MSDPAPAPEAGHNANSLFPLVSIQTETLALQLGARYGDLNAQVAKHEAAYERFKAKWATAVMSEEAAGRAADWVRLQLLPLGGDKGTAETSRAYEKGDILKAQRTVDGFFSALRQRVAVITQGVRAAQLAYANEQERLERERLAAAAKAQREEAARLAAQAEVQRDADKMAEAVAAEDRGEALQAKAEAEVVKAAPIRGSYGGTSSVRTTWTFKVDDIGKVPLHYLQVNEAMVTAAIKSAKKIDNKPDISIPGISLVAQRSVV